MGQNASFLRLYEEMYLFVEHSFYNLVYSSETIFSQAELFNFNEAGVSPTIFVMSEQCLIIIAYYIMFPNV